ncbi:MAG TPA: acetyl-CoA carboxylase biotin carboxyl carrier protein [Oceanipulchritudo sp.]|nr:acetyl-CoA carboxylase biotin carboxyl carrier protein [Oceanipulchritudo sp.]
MDFKEIKAIVELMKRSGLTEFQIEEQDFKLRICRKSDEVQTIYQTTTPAPFPMPMPQQNMAAPQQNTPPAEPVRVEVDESKLIKSPMVGTFYTSPSPESPPFIKLGDAVVPETVVCILEAMKVMNEIKAEVKGKIVEILAENGDSIEYGQPLFRIE